MKPVKAKLLISVAVSVLALNAAGAYAEHRPRDPGVNGHQHLQQDRIKQGVRSGSLTREETQGLRQEGREIRQMERAYKSDGVLNREERKTLHQALNERSRNLYEEKHDDERR